MGPPLHSITGYAGQASPDSMRENYNREAWIIRGREGRKSGCAYLETVNHHSVTGKVTLSDRNSPLEFLVRKSTRDETSQGMLPRGRRGKEPLGAPPGRASFPERSVAAVYREAMPCKGEEHKGLRGWGQSRISGARPRIKSLLGGKIYSTCGEKRGKGRLGRRARALSRLLRGLSKVVCCSRLLCCNSLRSTLAGTYPPHGLSTPAPFSSLAAQRCGPPSIPCG